MALEPINEQHAKQIDAGTRGRRRGHKFEETLTYAIISLNEDLSCLSNTPQPHVKTGNPAETIINYILFEESINPDEIKSVYAWWLGGLATSGDGDLLYDENGNKIDRCKSDVLVEIKTEGAARKRGVSVKTCSKKTPTNDQMFFTTARAFCNLLENNGINVSREARTGLSMFCGDFGYRPVDLMSSEELNNRLADPDRFFWEEMPQEAQDDWRMLFSANQAEITRLLFQKAYAGDAYPPEYLLHQTVKYDDFNSCETATFSIDEIVELSMQYSGFALKPYSINKGRYKADPGTHYAPRFGFIQFQRGGQKQHPTQLQFNLKSGYFRTLE